MTFSTQPDVTALPRCRRPLASSALVALLLLAGLASSGCTVVGFDTPYNKGVDAYNAGDLPEAAEHFRQATEARPDFYEAFYNLARVYDELARSRMKLAAQREADRQREAVARSAGVAPETESDGDGPGESVEATPAELRQLAREDAQKAEAAYRRCLELNPKAARALVSYAMFRYEQGETNEAFELLERAVVAQPDRAWPLAALGLHHQRQGRRNDAFDAYRKALAKEPDDALTNFRLGTWYEADGDMQTARRHYEVAVTNSPEDSLYWRRLGYLLVEVNEPLRGARALETSIEHDPGGEPTRADRIQTLLDIARAYASVDYHERAVYSLWRARDLRADDSLVSRLLIESYRALGRQEATRLIESGGAPDTPPDEESGTEGTGGNSAVSSSGD